MAKKSKINRVRTLYAAFIGIIAVCILLFVLNVVTAADPQEFSLPQGHNPRYALRITDLESPTAIRRQALTVDGLRDSLVATARVASFDLDIAGRDNIVDSRSSWCMALQVGSVLVMLAAVVLVILALVSFYVSTKRGKLFPPKNIVKLRWVGILIIVMSLMIDVSTGLERAVAADLLAGSDWQPQVGFSIHVTRLILGLTIIFMAEIFSIGQKMQEEQELTI